MGGGCAIPQEEARALGIVLGLVGSWWCLSALFPVSPKGLIPLAQGCLFLNTEILYLMYEITQRKEGRIMTETKQSFPPPTGESLCWWERMPSAGGLGSCVAAVVIAPRQPRPRLRVRVAVLQHLTYRSLATQSTGAHSSPWLRVEKTVSAAQLRPRAAGEWTPPAGWDEWLRPLGKGVAV